MLSLAKKSKVTANHAKKYKYHKTSAPQQTIFHAFGMLEDSTIYEECGEEDHELDLGKEIDD